ncbi:MAG: hypothetical protein GX823_02295, partial [Clostridiales bacterium]|nr:hypothetical protein [Clostridiales bacterium]
MKLSYKSSIWESMSMPEHMRLAEEMELDGFELEFSEQDARLLLDDVTERTRTLRRLGERRLAIPCISVDVRRSVRIPEIRRHALMAIELASSMRIPNVCLDAEFDTS